MSQPTDPTEPVHGPAPVRVPPPDRTRGNPRRWLRGRGRGQGLVEFALILPVLLLILLFGIDFGRVFLGWINLNNAARIAANYAATNPTASFGSGSAYEAIVLRDTTGIDCTLSTIAQPTFSPDTNVGSSASVTFNCRFTPLTPLVSAVQPNITVTARSVFTIRTGVIPGVPAPTPLPCVAPNLVVPSLVGLTLSAARSAWTSAGFTGPFKPPSGHSGNTVTGQVPSAGSCRPATQTVVASWQ